MLLELLLALLALDLGVEHLTSVDEEPLRAHVPACGRVVRAIVSYTPLARSATGALAHQGARAQLAAAQKQLRKIAHWPRAAPLCAREDTPWP